MNEDIAANLQVQIDGLLARGLTSDPNDLWSVRAAANIRKFIDSDGRLDMDTVENFRRRQVFVNEAPGADRRSLKDHLSGWRRAGWRLIEDRYDVMKEAGDLEWVRKYPIAMPGNPYVFEKDGYRFNKRWSHNIRYLSLAAAHLGDTLKADRHTLLDIGGGYGIFPMLMKREFPNVSPLLLEFPEQLLLAYYFIRSCHPDWKVNTIDEAEKAPSIDADFVAKYDFVLVPISCFEKIAPDFVTIASNFFSLGEMSEEWFDAYINSGPVRNARYFITINRFFSRPTYNTSIDVLRYGLEKYRKIYFEESKYELGYYEGRCKFFTKYIPYTSRFFEFIGERQ